MDPAYLLLVVYCQHHFLHYKYLPYNHTNSSLSLSLSLFALSVQALSRCICMSCQNLFSRESCILRMGKVSRVSGLIHRDRGPYAIIVWKHGSMMIRSYFMVHSLLWSQCCRRVRQDAATVGTQGEAAQTKPGEP